MAEVKKRGRPSQPGSGSQKGAQALERGIAVLNYLAQSGGSSSVSNIAENLSLPLSTTFRLLKVLEEADFVYQDAQLSWWHIGLQAFTVGSSYIHNRDVLSVAAPYMQRLMLLSGETANLAIRNGFEAVLIGQRECQSMVRMCAPLGSRLPLHASGAGKALLYSLDDEALIRRIILKRCVFGVDLNPMAVELAKLSLWLHSFTVGAPLSFLDHHLCCGDSLFGEFVQPVLEGMQARYGSVAELVSQYADLLSVASPFAPPVAKMERTSEGS